MLRPLFVVALLALATAAEATEAAGAAVERSRAILADPRRWVDPAVANPVPKVDATTADAIRAIAADAMAQPVETIATPPSSRLCRLFVSQSMPATELAAALARARSDPALIVVLRGVAPEQTLGQLTRRLLALSGRAETGSRSPAIELDPPRFTAAGIRTVPTLVCYDGDRELARVAGLIDPDWLRREIDGGRRGDFGTLGELLTIVEPDLLRALQQRAEGWDLAALRRGAEARYWQRHASSVLAVATEARSRRVDPSFVVAADLTAPDGRRIATAGETVNPLTRVPFTQRLVVFDATDARQCAALPELIRSAGERRVTLMTTRWDAQRGFDGLAALSHDLGRPVFLLGPEVIERFRLERVPSVVEADGPAFVVTEFVPGAE